MMLVWAKVGRKGGVAIALEKEERRRVPVMEIMWGA